jgi:hypothetical protein
MNKRTRGCAVFVFIAIGCAKSYPATAPTPDRISYLIAAVASSRATLDSAVTEIHRVSADTSSPSVARSRQMRRRASSLDSAYRARIAELQSAISASTTGAPTSGTHFPIEPPPAPFVHAFADGGNWMLQSPLIHEIGEDGRYVVIVPRGFVTDFASIPQVVQVLRGVRPTTERYGVAAVVHDYLYWRQDCTREQSDRIMAIAMKEAGVSMLERTLIYEAVRQFGQSAWDGNRSARQTGLIRTVAPPYDEVPPTGTWDEYRAWLRTTRAKEGIEYRVPGSVCEMADSLSSR